MLIGVPAETAAGETRVAVTPETAKKLVTQGHQVRVQAGAGVAASAVDAAYQAAGAEITDAAGALGAEMVLKVRPPSDAELALTRPGTVLVGMLEPFNAEGLQKMAAAGLTAFALEAAPRTTRAQSMDVLSSQANIAGYKAVMMGADAYPRLFPMLMTAAGTIKAARVVILGVGVAGLQAIATAKRLGAKVTAFDTRPVVAEQVRSVGAKFLEIDLGETGETAGGYATELTPEQVEKQRQAQKDVIAKSDVVITTAQVFGRKPPVLVTRDMIEGMAPGSVIVDMAAETGGNVEGSVPNEVVKIAGVTVIGKGNLAGEVARDASVMYSANLFNLVEDSWNKDDAAFVIDFEHDILPGCIITHGGEVTNTTIKNILEGGA